MNKSKLFLAALVATVMMASSESFAKNSKHHSKKSHKASIKSKGKKHSSAEKAKKKKLAKKKGKDRSVSSEQK